MTGRIRDMILDPDQTGRLAEAIEEGDYYGMQTFDQALLKHVPGRAHLAGATRCRPPRNPHDFKLLVASDGQRSTSVDQVFAGGPERRLTLAAALPVAYFSS